MVIQFFFADAGILLTQRKKLKIFISKIFKSKRRECTCLAIIFCRDEYLLKINQQFLNHDYYTDIITFNLAEKNEPVNAEIYISVDRVKENSKISNVLLSNELHRVIFHGVLHLCGFGDKSSVDKAKMTLEENKYLKRYFVSKAR
jgi:probable rRNA maturation factor